MRHLTGFYPSNIRLYHKAFIHKSVQRKGNKGEIVSNERLEFLGDAILGAVVASELFHRFPEKDEGALTKMRARIVNRNLLNQVGNKMQLEQFIRSQAQLDLSQTHVVGDAVEALIGAVYLDKGFANARRFILKRITGQFINFEEVAVNDSNYKSMLIEWGHKHRQVIEFKTEEIQDCPNFQNYFHSKVYINEQLMGEGQAPSKKEAQQKSAQMALEHCTEAVTNK